MRQRVVAGIREIMRPAVVFNEDGEPVETEVPVLEPYEEVVDYTPEEEAEADRHEAEAASAIARDERRVTAVDGFRKKARAAFRKRRDGGVWTPADRDEILMYLLARDFTEDAAT